MKKIVILFQTLCFFVLLRSFSNCIADGCFFYDIETHGKFDESPNQHALFIHNGEKGTLLLQVKYAGVATIYE